MPLIERPNGDYSFLSGLGAYSRGAIAQPGYEIAQVTFQTPVDYRDGFDRIAAWLEREERPRESLCGIQLRCPKPYSFDGFTQFNEEYIGLLTEWGGTMGDANPVARTNVAPVLHAPASPKLYSFSYTRRGASVTRPTFIVAGGGELPEGSLSRNDIVSLGNISADGLTNKAKFVMDLMHSRLEELGADWSHVTHVNVYTEHPLAGLLRRVILRREGEYVMHGAAWHYSRPPVEEIEFEMDVRGTGVEFRC